MDVETINFVLKSMFLYKTLLGHKVCENEAAERCQTYMRDRVSCQHTSFSKLLDAYLPCYCHVQSNSVPSFSSARDRRAHTTPLNQHDRVRITDRSRVCNQV